MNKKYIILALIVVIAGIIIIGLYNNLEQQRQNNERLTEMYEPKTLTLSPNTIQIISVDTQNPGAVCSNPKDYTYWWVSGLVDFSQISQMTYADGSRVSDSDVSNFAGFPYVVHIGQFEIDGRTANVDRSGFLSVNRKDVNGNRFSFALSDVSPTEGHIVKATFTLEQSYIHITSTPVDVTYSMPKIC